MRKSLKFWSVSIVLISIFLVVFYAATRIGDINRDDLAGNPGITMTGIALGTLVSEDLSTITSGLLAGAGILKYWQAVLAAYTGILIGDALIFWMGYHFGRPVLRHRWSRFLVRERAVNRAQYHFHKNGLWIILLTRFIPGTRTATYFAAGAVRAPVLSFLCAFALAAALWTPFLVGLSFYTGKRLLDFYHLYEAVALPVIILAGLILYLLIHYGIPAFTWKGRRRIKGKWIRATHWEFWPTWQVYWLVVLYILVTGIVRYRNPLLFTAANPAMPDGGVIGESKADILKRLAGAGGQLPPWGIIGEGELENKLIAFDRLMHDLNLSYPVVLKPDEGQRGLGVVIVESRETVANWLAENDGRAILQAYAAGQEYGIFYSRKPSEKQGQIISITIKDQLSVEGNGSDSLETLIHAHPRAIAMLNLFLDRFAGQLQDIPKKGEIIHLGQLGTHSRGSLFLDGHHLHSESLRKSIQSIADHFDGFHFGRFDLKAPDDEALMRGEGIRIIELNGVTSEVTHIYDPQHGLFHAWRQLCRQWRLAFEIAAENVRAGHPPTPMGPFLRNLREAGRRQANAG